MTNVTLFAGNELVNTDLFKSLQNINDNLLSGSNVDTRRRISLNGGKFRLMENGEQVLMSRENNLNCIIVNAATISRTYYSGVYDAHNPTPPKCWSSNTNAPSLQVPVENRQASRCMDCPQNIKGSGQGESRACRFSQRIAVVLEGDLNKVYQLQLPATSIFGDAKDGNLPMQAYARFLNAHNTPVISIITNIRFDENSSTPKLLFKAIRPLDEEELKKAIEMKSHSDTMKAITMTVAQTDGVREKEVVAIQVEKTSEKTTEKSIFSSVDDAPVEEPKKVVKKPAPKEVVDQNLASVLDNWDD
tara:strand:- start:7918 stop:8826 length:909 start_codon:yes stop_codon:yes gene_type:complete